MAATYVSTEPRSTVSMFDAYATDFLGGLRARWMQYRAYRRTLAELRGLPKRTLDDLNFDRGDLAGAVHREVYGH